MGDFGSSSVWMKSSFMLIAIGFVVWLSAGSVGLGLDTDLANAYAAFLIIGVCAYFVAVMLTYLYIYIEDTAGNKVVLIVAAVAAFLAGVCAVVSLGIARSASHSARLAYAAACAITSGVFCILEMRNNASS